MKKNLFILVLPVILFSCSTRTLMVAPMGQLNQVSTRNIEISKKYEPLMTYAGVSSSEIENTVINSKKGKVREKDPVYKEISRYRGNTINEAVDNVVKSQIGGEYLMNVRFYLVTERVREGKIITIKNSFVAAGDVWGRKDSVQNIKGFRLKDKVVFTYDKEIKALIKKNFKGIKGVQYFGEINNLMGSEATIELENGTFVDIPYTRLRKVNN